MISKQQAHVEVEFVDQKTLTTKNGTTILEIAKMNGIDMLKTDPEFAKRFNELERWEAEEKEKAAAAGSETSKPAAKDAGKETSGKKAEASKKDGK